MTAATLAVVTRGGLIESEHRGHLAVVAADGALLGGAGDPDAVIYARSSLKPLQAIAMLESGLRLPVDLLALACASHNGEDVHLDGARRTLAVAGLHENDLQNTPDNPIGEDALRAWLQAGKGPQSLAQNCSGKHAAMLATCVTAGWPTESYLDGEHPLQRRVRATVAELTGRAADFVTVDGCGAPLFSSTLSGLARAFAAIAAAAATTAETPGAVVGRAMNRHNYLVAGRGRDVTALMSALPGVVAKDGAEGVYAVGLPDGRGVALKVLDGGQRPRPVIMSAVLRRLGVHHPVLDEVGTVRVLGHGMQVGIVEATLAEELLR